MKRRNKSFIIYMVALVFCALFSIAFSNTKKADAATTMGYRFDYNGKDIESSSGFDLVTEDGYLSVKPKDGTEGLPVNAKVSFHSSNPNVISLEETQYESMTKMVRKGPGFSTITAIITVDGYNFSISCLVKVDLKIIGSNFSTIDYEGHRILKLDKVGAVKPIDLRYVDDKEILNSIVLWESSNEMVATVNEKGEVKAVGAGRAEITVSTQTVSNQSAELKQTVSVIVAPIGSFQYSADYSGYTSVVSGSQISADNFKVYINSQSAQSLKWKVYQLTRKKNGELVEKELKEKETNDVLKFSINQFNGSVNFWDVKAGTYVIRAYIPSEGQNGEEYIGNNLVPSFEAQVVVLYKLTDMKLVMNVGDTYNIIENSNIASVGQFYYKSSNPNVASIDSATGTITAKNSSTTPVTITMSYKDTGMFETGGGGEYNNGVPDIKIEVTVIDGIQLSYSEITLDRGSSILLEPTLTNEVEEIVWTSSDSKVAKVENGLVTGLKEGTAIITVTQKINGIEKNATCTVHVQTAVESVTLDPKKITLGIGKYETIQALVKPSTLKGVSLRWISSNEEVLKISEEGKLSATVQGISGGTAVVSAINQDNVVVGFCEVIVLQPVTGMKLSEEYVIARIEDKVQLRATVTPDNATNQKVTWKSSNTSVATVSDNGLVTMKSAGTASIICTSVDNPTVQAFCNVTVLKPVSSISLDIDSKEMYVGENYRLTYLVIPSDASTTEVTWTTTNKSVVAVDGTGMLTAKGVGQAEIIVKTVDGSYMDLCTIVVKQKPTNVKMAVSNLTMNAGEYFYMDAVLTPANSTKEGLVWESIDTSIVTVSSTGRITAKKAGKTVVMVKTDNGATSYCVVTVLEAVTGLEITPGKVTLDVGEKIQLYTEFTPATASNTVVTWSSSDEDVATVDKDGEVTAKQGGLVVIQCQSDDGGYNAVCIITVIEEVTELTISPEQYKLGLGKTFRLEAEIKNSTASNKDIEWSSSDESVVTVDQNGKIRGVGLGYATITAMALDGSDVEATCEIRVVTEVTGMKMNYTSITLIQGETFQLDAEIRPAEATYNTPAWESDNANIALVDDDGIVTAISPGTAWITAKARDNGGKYCKCFVTVIAPIPATGVSTMVDKVVMAPGEKKTIVAKATPANTTDSMMWTSTDESIVRVNPVSGEITAISPGSASVIVMMDSGKKAVVEVIVVGLNRTSVVMDYYSTGVMLYVEGATSTVRWYSTNPRVVEVVNGRLTSRGSGTATIEARVNGRTLTCTVRVVSP